jgi:hypothetical protein
MRGKSRPYVGPFILHASPLIPPVFNCRSSYLHTELFSQLIFLAGKILIGPSRERLDTEAVRDFLPVPEDQSNEAPKSGDERYLAEHPMSWMCSTLDPFDGSEDGRSV